MNDYLISVIVPVYKVEKYLDRCVESIVNQTYKNLEIILVDDGSPDKCPQICDEWAKKDARIKVIHKKNEGVAAARNDALAVAQGDYIGFVDSDDYIDCEMYNDLLKSIIDTESDITICGYFFNDSNAISGNFSVAKKNSIIKELVLGEYKYGVLWNKLYRKSAINNIRMPDFVCSEDLVFNYYVFKNAKTICEIKHPYYHYCQNEDGTIKGKFAIGAFDAVKAKQIILENEMSNRELKPYAIKGLINSAFVVLSGCIQNDMFPDERDNLIAIILKYKKEILLSSLYSKLEKIKTLLLSFSPNLYFIFIKRRNS